MTPLPANPTKNITLFCIITPHDLHKIKNHTYKLIKIMKKGHQLMDLKIQPYFDIFIYGSATNYF